MGLVTSRNREVEVPRAGNALETLPSQWIFYLDPKSLLCVQTAGLRIDKAVEQTAWKELCAQDLGCGNLQLDGPTPGGSSCWRRVFYDLDVGNLQNELRATSADYEFLPSLYGESAMVPEGMDFAVANGRTSRCRLSPSYLGRDRCVVARWPLPSALSATVVKGAETRVAYRSAGYYEVTIGSSQEHEMVLPCISVGLCSPRFSRHAVARQQAGWDGESWAWHSDDGLLFHASNRGYAFDNAAGHAAASSHRTVAFGASDVVGCGVYQAPDAGGAEAVLHAPRKIFYTLNGTFVGFAFELDIPSNVPLWPCVGVDTKQWLSFNFGSEPFHYDLQQMGNLEVSLKSRYDTFADWSSCAADTQNASGVGGNGPGKVSATKPMRPLVAKMAPRRFLDVTRPALEVVRRYQSQPRWLDAVDRLVNATLLDATADGANRSRLEEFFPLQV